MRCAQTRLLSLLIAVPLLTLPATAIAQRNVREIMNDHSAVLQAGDLSLTFIYLHPDSTGREVAEAVLRSEEFIQYEREVSRLPRNHKLLALRLVPFRDARFDPTLIRLTERENTHKVGFMDLVDVSGLFMSTVKKGDYVFGFIKVPETIDFKRTVTIEYERYKIPFILPLKWRQKYFQFLDPPGR